MARTRRHKVEFEIVEYESPSYPWNTEAEIVEQIDRILERELIAPLWRVKSSIQVRRVTPGRKHGKP